MHQSNDAPSTAAVIMFSRSGNTAVLARHFATQHNADFFQLRANDYALGLIG